MLTENDILGEQLRLFGPPAAVRRTAPHPRSVMFEDCVEGGAFDYASCPVLLGRVGIGPLRVAWDTNILIDYGSYGHLIWSDEPFHPPVTDPAYRQELNALENLMQLWMYRDIRIHVFDSQIEDAKRALVGERRELRKRQIEQIAAALHCLGHDTNHWQPREGEAWPEACELAWMRPGPDRSLLEQAVDAGCHVFLTRDAGIISEAAALAHYWLSVTSPAGLLDALADSDELTWTRIGQFIMPDSHKWSHVMAACEPEPE